MRAVFLAAGCALVMAVPAAAQRTYAGQEAAALRCANTLGLTAYAAGRAGVLDPRQAEVILFISGQILERHVSGSPAQKRAALRQMFERRDAQATLEDFLMNSDQCLRQFPIN